jgi:hypothetical protein
MKRFILATGLVAAWTAFTAPGVSAGELRINEPYVNDENPAVAVNTRSGDSLVVEDSNGNITAVLLDRNGVRKKVTVLGSYSASYYGPVEPAVTYNPTHNEFFAVWRFPSVDSLVKGRRLNASGDALGNEIRIMDVGASSPSVAYSPASRQYLVVAAYGGIEARVVHWNGVTGSYIPVTDYGHYYAGEPDVTYNSTANEFFVVWQDKYYSGYKYDLVGQRLGAFNGTRLGGHIGVAMDGGRSRTHPDVVYNAAQGEYAVAHEYDFNGADHDIKVKRLSRYGTSRGETTIAAQTNWEGKPVISHNPATGEYLIAYEYAYSGTDHDIRTQRMASYGARIGNPAWVALSGKWEGEPDLVYNPLTNEFLAVYEYAWSGADHDIRGWRLSAYGYRL